MKLLDKYEELQNKNTPQSKIIEQIFRTIEEEDVRQKNEIELIASENYTFEEVMMAAGSILTNKYAEGYPEKRYYGGCEIVDKIETIAIEQCKKLFHCGYVNVQPHSGSQANQAVYTALLSPGDKILGMSLDCGGHLTHGSKVSSSGIVYESHFYGVNSDGYIDYDEVEKIASDIKPKLIVCGASAYSRIIDFAKLRKIADKVGAYLMADIAHIAGLVVANIHPSPIGIAHVVTSTTHKTLRGTRGGIIMTNDEELSKKINKAVFPGIQGGPLMHIIAAKAVGFAINETSFFKKYIKSVVENAKVMAEELKRDFNIISGGTDNHLMLVDVSKIGMTGLDAETKLKKIGITVNKNTIPNDKNKPSVTSGIRIGTAAVTSRGFNKNDCLELARIIADCLTCRGFDENHLKDRVNKLLTNKPYKFKWTDVYNNL